jgi:thiosulfate/3-mercaptopyruvate sulfurtransferase
MNIRRCFSLALLLTLVLAAGVSLASAQAKLPMVVSTDWLSSHLSDPDLVVLAVGGSQGSYAGGHIPGARYLDLHEIVQSAAGWNALPPLSTLKTAFERVGVGNRSLIVLYGESKGMLAARAYVTLDYLGLGGQAALLDGGLEKWSSERRPITTDLVTPKASTLAVQAHPEVVTDLASVMKAVSSKTLPIVDARSPADFAGAKGGVAAARTGHIPGAKDVYWMETLAASGVPVFKSTAEIRSRYQSAGLKPGAKVVVYCRSGMQASVGYFTLKLAGYKPVLYPGSFSEWVAAFGTAVENGN